MNNFNVIKEQNNISVDRTLYSSYNSEGVTVELFKLQKFVDAQTESMNGIKVLCRFETDNQRVCVSKEKPAYLLSTKVKTVFGSSREYHPKQIQEFVRTVITTTIEEYDSLELDEPLPTILGELEYPNSVTSE